VPEHSAATESQAPVAQWESAEGTPRSAEFTVANAYADDPLALRAAFEHDGYVFLRGCLPEHDVLDVRARILTRLHELGWIESPYSATPTAGFTTSIGEESYWPGLSAVLGIPAVAALTDHPALTTVLECLYGEPALRQPRRVPRMIFPRPNPWSEMAAHQDHTYIQGSLDAVTAWIPFGDCLREDGSLEVLRGSHCDGWREIFGGGRVRCASTPVDNTSSSWRGTDYRVGDVLLFTSLTVHRARPNASSRIRLSMDCRFQPRASKFCDAVLEPAFYPHVGAWKELLPDHPELYAVPSETEIQPFVEPRHYRPQACGRVFPWLRA
jgi:hypothetical protein